MKIRVTKGAAQGIHDAEPCASPNHAQKPPHLTVTVAGGPWCIYEGEYEAVGGKTLPKRRDPFGFDPAHIVDMRVEMASDNDTIPADWPCQIVRRAAALMKERARNATFSASGRWIVRGEGNSYPQSIADNASAILVADAFEAPGVNRTATHITMLDPVVVVLIAEAWEHQADDMADDLAHLHATEPLQGGKPGWFMADENERAREDWTATLRAALAYLREDAPEAVGSDA